jgi:hypothetical protein
MTTSANDVQHGGAHYKGAFQHWDYVAVLGLGYFEAQITRYISRHRKKAGLLDVQKAEHYVQKLIELTQAGMPQARRYNFNGDAKAFIFEMNRVLFNGDRDVYRSLDPDHVFHRKFVAAQDPAFTQEEAEIVFLAAFWNERQHLERALQLVRKIKDEYAAADANRAYNAQSLDPPPAPPTLTPEQVRAADDVAQHATGGRPC